MIRLALALLPAVAATAGMAGEPMATASAVAIKQDGAATHFELSLDRPVEFNVFALADPYRVIIDLPEIKFRLPSGAGTEGEGVVAAFRYGIFQPGKSRIVVDLAGPASIIDPEIVETEDSTSRLQVEFAVITRQEFLRDYALNGQGGPSVPPAPRLRPALPAGPRKANDKPVIVIDPGHGGVDPGAVGRSGTREKDVVLAFARQLRDRLGASGLFTVLMTRERDIFLQLRARREFARSHGADLFISIHADSIRSGRVRGATVYTVSEKASDQEAAALAAQENRADLIAGMQLEEFSEEVSGILVDLTRRNTMIESIDFADSTVSALRDNIRLNSNPTRHAGFVVLKAHDVPSVLIELGYLSNTADEERLSSGDWQGTAAEAIVRAAKAFFSRQIAGTQ